MSVIDDAASLVVSGASTVVSEASTVVSGASTVVSGASTVVSGASTVVSGASTAVSAVQDLYSSFGSDVPIVGYRFSVWFFIKNIPNPIDIRFKEVNGLQLSRPIEEKKQVVSLGRKTPLQTLVLKRGVIAKPSPLSLAQSVEAQLWKYLLLTKRLLICVLDESGVPVASWDIPHASLETWSWDGVNGDASDVLIETMSFKYKTIRYIPPGITNLHTL